MTAGANRRRFLGAAAVTACGTIIGLATGAGWSRLGQPGTLLRSRCPLPPTFRSPLPIPPILRPSRVTADTDYYEITQHLAEVSILPGFITTAWTYAGSFPGPTLVSRAGRRTVVRHINRLPHPVVVHLHGGHTPHDSDGYPLDLIAPAAAMPGTAAMPGVTTIGYRDYVYPLRQPAATLWYHDHRMGFTGPGVWYGLAGFHLIHDEIEDALPLPRGHRDIPLMITDRAFTADGQLLYPLSDRALRTPGTTPAYRDGVLGDIILVNGAPWPVLPVDRARYRLRLLNASNARRYRLRLDPPPLGGGGLVQIGSDGGLLDHPITHDDLPIAPAERFDVVVDFHRYPPGARVQLTNTLGSDATARIMRFDIATGPAPTDDTRIPHTLAAPHTLDPAGARTTRTFAFQSYPGGWRINGCLYQPGTDIARPRLGDTEIWRFTTDFHHPIHTHLGQFRILTRDDRPPRPSDHGWKDTIDLGPAETAEIAVRFTDYPGRYLLHCHNLEHEDMGMMADFTTI